jgi:hypothetical protein
MTTRGAIPHPDNVDPGRRARERAALHAVLASHTFENKPRLANLLKYICERHFDGDTGAIKEYSIATDIFGRTQSFDQATDSIVRVEAFRLRKKLREFYEGEGADQPIEIVVATGHYRPEFIDRTPEDRIPGDRLQNSFHNSVLMAPRNQDRGLQAEGPSYTSQEEEASRKNRIHLHDSPSKVAHKNVLHGRGGAGHPIDPGAHGRGFVDVAVHSQPSCECQGGTSGVISRIFSSRGAGDSDPLRILAAHLQGRGRECMDRGSIFHRRLCHPAPQSAYCPHSQLGVVSHRQNGSLLIQNTSGSGHL